MIGGGGGGGGGEVKISTEKTRKESVLSNNQKKKKWITKIQKERRQKCEVVWGQSNKQSLLGKYLLVEGRRTSLLLFSLQIYYDYSRSR